MIIDSRFVIVDGNRNFHQLMRGLLRSLGCRRVDAFFDAPDAIAHVTSTFVDMIFTDIHLATASGMDFIRDVRHAKLVNPDLRIVVVTAYTSLRTIEEAVSAGADHILAKPVSPRLIAERVDVLLRRRPDYIRTDSGYFGPDPHLLERRLRRPRVRQIVLPAAPVAPVTPLAPRRTIPGLEAAQRPDENLVFLD